jgi:hypothetical protein
MSAQSCDSMEYIYWLAPPPPTIFVPGVSTTTPQPTSQSKFIPYSRVAAIDGQVCLARLVCLQMENIRLFLHKETDKRLTSVCTITNGKRIRENHRFSSFPNTYIYIYVAGQR